MLSQCPASPLTAHMCGLCVWELFGDCSFPLELVSVAFLLSWLQFTFIPSWWRVKWTIRLTNYWPTPRGVVGYVWLNLWFPVTALSKAFGTYWSPKHALTLKWPNTLKIREYTADVYTVGVEETEPPARQDYKKKICTHFTEITQSIKVCSVLLYEDQNYTIFVFGHCFKNGQAFKNVLRWREKNDVCNVNVSPDDVYRSWQPM